ncbi:histidine phosphatase family protein [Magnetococcus sp. PR-3]|uniref:histidine phosphatase family protein n=1 Tax=Magnetococcus sp. PR-3 TaxID=3120355 RepID=UPI002FCE09D3
MQQLLKNADLSQCSLIMRHGPRLIIEDATKAEQVMLTDEGQVASRQLGADLFQHQPPAHIFHSTIARCGQTAQCMLEGMAHAAHGVENHGGQHRLAACYLPNNQHTYQYCKDQDMDTLQFIQKWFEGDLSADLAVPAQGAAQDQLYFMREQHEQRGGFQVHVSHDWNMMLFIWRYLGLTPSWDVWPSFLEGVLLTWSDDGVWFRFREHEKKVALA